MPKLYLARRYFLRRVHLILERNTLPTLCSRAFWRKLKVIISHYMYMYTLLVCYLCLPLFAPPTLSNTVFVKCTRLLTDAGGDIPIDFKECIVFFSGTDRISNSKLQDSVLYFSASTLYPTATTCVPQLTLPIRHHNNYSQIKANMSYAFTTLLIEPAILS